MRKADQIVVVEGECIVGQGLHDGLVESNPVCRRLYRRQWVNAQPESTMGSAEA